MIINAHSDFLIAAIHQYEQNGSTSLLHSCRDTLDTGRVDAVVCSVGGDGSSFPAGHARTLDYLRCAVGLAGESAGAFRVAHSAREMEEARQRGSVALLLGLEGGHALEGGIDNLVGFHKEGLRWLGLTWNGTNELGDGCGETVNGGLTAFGREVVLTANRLGILVDLSHASRATCDDAVRISRAPTIASHSNASALCSHPRNLTDEQMHKIARHGGVIGVNFFPALLAVGRPATGHDILAHIRHITRLVGCGHVALGPDFVGPDSLETLQDYAESRGVDYGECFHYPHGFSDERCFPRVERLVADMGMEHVDVSLIMGSNVMRVLREVERESHCLRQACL